MEAIVGLGAFLAMMLAFGAGFFLFVVQPIWSIVDVATCERLSKGAKAVIIVLTLILLGPIMTIGYAVFGTHSRGLRSHIRPTRSVKLARHTHLRGGIPHALLYSHEKVDVREGCYEYETKVLLL